MDEMTVRHRASGSTQDAQIGDGNGSASSSTSTARKRSVVALKNNDSHNNFEEEWQTLYGEAKSITAESSKPEIVWKICKFFINDGSPVFMLVLIFNIVNNIDGEESWWKASVPLTMKVISSLTIAYYLCNEKREVCKAKQGQKWGPMLKDVLYKTISVIVDWITEWSREKKRTQKVKIIEDNLYRNEESGRWMKKKGIVELKKFYSSHLRYIREDILVASLRSFPLAMFFIYKICDPENMALRVCTIGDVLKFIYVIWVILKISLSIKSFEDARNMYVATDKLTEAAWQSSMDLNSTIKISQYHPIHKFNRKWTMKILDILLNFLLMASRFLAATLCMVIYFPYGFLAWYSFVIVANVALLDSRLFFDFIGELRSIFDNPPTGYSTRRHKWIDRFTTTVFYNYGYSRQGLKGALGWKTLFAIPATVLFFVLQFLISFISNPITNATSLTRTSFVQNFSIGVLKCELSSTAVDLIDYVCAISGVRLYITQFILFLFFSFILESIQKYLQQCENINLNSFDVFPYFDATDCYRSLIRHVLKKERTPINIDGRDNSRTDSQTAVVKNGEVFIRQLMALTLVNSEAFYVPWSKFYSDTNEFAPEFLNVINTAIVRLSQLYNVLKVGLTPHEASKLGIKGDSFSLKDLHARADFANLRWKVTEISNVTNVSREELSTFKIGNKITLGELIAIRQIKNLQSHDHPLEPCIPFDSQNVIRNSNDSTLISNMFRRIQRQTVDNNLKQIDILLFTLFCFHLNNTLSQMSSYRIERTCEMMQVKIGKDYEDDDDFQ